MSPGHDFLYGDVDRSTVPEHGGLHLDDGEQLLDRVCRSAFLPETEKTAHQDDTQDDAGIDAVAQGKRKDGGRYQDEDYGALELAKKQAQRVGPLASSKRVGAVARKAFSRFFALKSLRSGVDLGEKIGRRSVPERQRCHAAPEGRTRVLALRARDSDVPGQVAD